MDRRTWTLVGALIGTFVVAHAVLVLLGGAIDPTLGGPDWSGIPTAAP